MRLFLLQQVSVLIRPSIHSFSFFLLLLLLFPGLTVCRWADLSLRSVVIKLNLRTTGGNL